MLEQNQDWEKKRGTKGKKGSKGIREGKGEKRGERRENELGKNGPKKNLEF